MMLKPEMDKSVSDILEVLTRDGMSYADAKKVFNQVQVILMRSSENFLDSKSAKEVLSTKDLIGKVDDKIYEAHQ